jgi:hypothetical protein
MAVQALRVTLGSRLLQTHLPCGPRCEGVVKGQRARGACAPQRQALSLAASPASSVCCDGSRGGSDLWSTPPEA